MVAKGLKYFGFGKAGPATSTGQDLCLSTCLKSINVSREVDEEDITCWAGDGNCTQQVKDTVQTSDVWTVEFEVSCFDWHTWQMLLGEEAVTTATLDLTLPKVGVVGAGGTFADPDIATDSSISVSSNQCSAAYGEEVFFTTVATAPAAPDEVQVGAGTLTFDPTMEGRSFKYCVGATFTDIETICYEEGNSLAELSFCGVICPIGCDELSDGQMICIPRLKLSPNFSFELTDGVNTATLTYTALSNGVSRKPVFLAKLPAGVF